MNLFPSLFRFLLPCAFKFLLNNNNNGKRERPLSKVTEPRRITTTEKIKNWASIKKRKCSSNCSICSRIIDCVCINSINIRKKRPEIFFISIDHALHCVWNGIGEIVYFPKGAERRVQVQAFERGMCIELEREEKNIARGYLNVHIPHAHSVTQFNFDYVCICLVWQM